MSLTTAFLLALALIFLGALVVSIIWWLANTAIRISDQPDFDSEIHWHKWAENQSKRQDL